MENDEENRSMWGYAQGQWMPRFISCCFRSKFSRFILMEKTDHKKQTNGFDLWQLEKTFTIYEMIDDDYICFFRSKPTYRSTNRKYPVFFLCICSSRWNEFVIVEWGKDTVDHASGKKKEVQVGWAKRAWQKAFFCRSWSFEIHVDLFFWSGRMKKENQEIVEKNANKKERDWKGWKQAESINKL